MRLPQTDNGAFSPRSSRNMRRAALALLIVMAVIYAIARNYEGAHWSVGFIRAFAEAAMVGGLADWFAVTALFRHPLGLPIPHTAIIPRKKDQIGDTMAQFLKENFLIPQVIARRMAALDVAGTLGHFLAHRASSAGRMRYGASRLFGDVLAALDPERMGGMIRAGLKKEMARVDIAPFLGQLIESSMAEGRHAPLLDAVIQWSARMLEKNEDHIYAIVHERANSILRWTGLDSKIAEAIVRGLSKLLNDMADDPEHPLRMKGEEALAKLGWRLKHDPVMQARAEEWKAELIANPALGQFIDNLWENMRGRMLESARNPDGALAGQLGEMLVQVGSTVESDARLKAQINMFARRAVVGTAASYGDAIVTLVSETVRDWDAETVTDRVEKAVGRDLQFIRINGTLVGGCVGLTLHAIGLVI